MIAVEAAGICGTDIHIVDDEFRSWPPVTMGHEVCGVVVEAGAGVDASWEGARVVSETYFSTCGACDHCRSGRINLCLERRSIGSAVDGAFAPRLLVPARGLHRVPEWLSSPAAALAEPLACVCNCLLEPARAFAPETMCWWSALGLSVSLPPRLRARPTARCTSAAPSEMPRGSPLHEPSASRRALFPRSSTASSTS